MPQRISVTARLTALALCAAGCTGPDLGSCAVLCDPSGGCPSGLTCNAADGFCHASGSEPLCTSSGGDDAGGNADGDAGDDAARARPCSAIDLLFIVDDSQTMDVEQAALEAAIPAFLTALDAHQTEAGESLDYRIGVTTTSRDVTFIQNGATISDVGPDGELLTTCAGLRILSRGDANLSANLACRVSTGIDGAGVEMPAYVLELALTSRVDDGTNAGFRRPDALFAIVVVTDEDDCSRRDDNFSVPNGTTCPASPMLWVPGDTLGFLDQHTGHRSRWSLAVSANPGNTDCSMTAGGAKPAPRLRDLVTAAGTNAQFYSVCESPATMLASALAQFAAACEQMQ